MVETVVHYRYLFDYSASIKLDTARKRECLGAQSQSSHHSNSTMSTT